ncbi:MAG: pyridoxal-phosphate dependent enzyme [Bacteroidota bacterium]
MNLPFSESPLQMLSDDLLREKEITLHIKRDDLIHPHIQGNKGRKLKYNLEQAHLSATDTLLTFGGSYSNHIYATAAAAKHFGLKSIGIIRGEEHLVKSPTLQFAVSQGMQLIYTSRESYRNKETKDYLENLRAQLGDFYLIPEGGTNMHALKGVDELISEVKTDYDYMCVACGTGGTLAGLVAGLKGEKNLLGFSSLKGEDSLTAKVNALANEYSGVTYSNFKINFDYHFGGYAKVKPELIEFIKQFKQRFDILLEPVYTGKMFYGLYDLIANDYFPKGSRIVAVHTGGLQGLSGYTAYFGDKNGFIR